MGSNLPELTTHVDRIYQAAVAPEQWPMFLESLSQELGAQTLHLAFRLPADGDGGVLITHGMDERFVDAYRTHFYMMDPWMPLLGLAPEGDIRALGDFVPHEELARTEFFEEWMRPQGIFHGFGAFLNKSGQGQLVSSLSGFRDKSRGPFRDEDLERIRPLVPHLRRALAIHGRVQSAELRAGAVADALDRIIGGVILVDERGAPIVTNRAADRILAMNDGLVLDRDGPRASTAQQTGELRRLLAGAAKPGAGNGEDAGAVLRLQRPSGRSALEAVVTPIGRESSPLFHERSAAAIFLADPDARAEPPPERLRRIYGLTQMEAEVASRMVRGMSLSEISDALRVSIHTIRGYLKQLFAKTNTHRQAELVRVFVAGPARIRIE